jgi:PAS domain S-box-containing protein
VHLHMLTSLIWSSLSFNLGLFLSTRSPRAEVSRLIGRLFFAISWWALAEFMWDNAGTPELALRWLHLGAIGYLFLGGLYLHVMLAFRGDAALLRRRDVLAWLYLPPAALLALIPLGVPLYRKVMPTLWGWAYWPSPIYGLFILHLLVCFAVGARLNLRYVRRARLEWERHQARYLFLAALVPMTLGFLTDAILPFLGIQVYRIGTTAVTIMAGTFIYVMFRYRFLLITPETVAAEVLSTVPESVFLVDLEGSMRPMNAAAASLVGCEVSSPRAIRMDEALEIDPRSHFARKVPPWLLTDVHDVEALLHERGERIPVTLSTSPLLDERRRLTGLVAVVRDVRELRRLQTQLFQSEKMAAVGHLAAGVAHEINNPMTYISSNLRKLREQLEALQKNLPAPSPDPAGDDAHARLDEMLEMVEETAEGTARIREIVQSVREFSHKGGGTPVSLDLNAEIESALRMASAEIKARSNVRRELSEIPPVLACRSEIQQVLVNLLVNAAQAFEASGTITVRSFTQDGRGVAEVEDDGPGVDPEVLPYIFDPFFTTKEVGKGTGLGLTISYQLLQRMGGRISVRSAERGGTIFRVELPLASS